MANPRFLKPEYIARVLDVTPKTVRLWILSGEIPGGYRFGNSLRVDKSEFMEYLRSKKTLN